MILTIGNKYQEQIFLASYSCDLNKDCNDFLTFLRFSSFEFNMIWSFPAKKEKRERKKKGRVGQDREGSLIL